MLTNIPHGVIETEAHLRRVDAANRRRANALRAEARQAKLAAVGERLDGVRFPKLTVRARYWLAA